MSHLRAQGKQECLLTRFLNEFFIIEFNGPNFVESKKPIREY